MFCFNDYGSLRWFLKNGHANLYLIKPYVVNKRKVAPGICENCDIYVMAVKPFSEELSFAWNMRQGAALD